MAKHVRPAEIEMDILLGQTDAEDIKRHIRFLGEKREEIIASAKQRIHAITVDAERRLDPIETNMQQLHDALLKLQNERTDNDSVPAAHP